MGGRDWLARDGPEIACCVCGEVTRARRRWSRLGFYRCEGCGVLFAHPQPADEALAAAYRSWYYPADPTPGARYRTTPPALAERLLACLLRHGIAPPRGGRLLDFGCGVGDFALTAVAAGIDVDAIEPDDVARTSAASRGVRVRRTLEELEREGGSGAYDVITLIDVVEHVRRPLDLLRALRRVVRSTGALYLSAPNYQSAQARLLGARWDQATNPTHLFLFSPGSMRHLLAAAGFRMAWLPGAVRDPTVGTLEGLVSVLLQQVRLSATLRVVARPV